MQAAKVEIQEAGADIPQAQYQCDPNLIIAALEKLTCVIAEENQWLQQNRLDMVARLLVAKHDVVQFLQRQEEELRANGEWIEQLSQEAKQSLHSVLERLTVASEINAKEIRKMQGYKEIVMKCISQAIEQVCNKNNRYDYRGKLHKPHNPAVSPSLSLNQQT